MGTEPQPALPKEGCLPEDMPVRRPEDYIGATVGEDHRIEGIEAIGSKVVVFRLVNLKSGQIDQVAKVPLEEFDPRTPLIRAIHGAMKDLRRDPDRVIRISERLLAIDSKCEAAAFNKGVALLVKKETSAALEAFNLAVALAPGDIWNLIHRAACFAALGKDDESLKDLQTAADLDGAGLRKMLVMVPRHAEAIRRALRRMAGIAGRREEARQALRTHFDLGQRFRLLLSRLRLKEG